MILLQTIRGILADEELIIYQYRVLDVITQPVMKWFATGNTAFRRETLMNLTKTGIYNVHRKTSAGINKQLNIQNLYYGKCSIQAHRRVL